MRKFTLTVLASSILLSACSMRGPVEEVALLQPESHYHDRMLDALGSQQYAEQQMVYKRKARELEQELDRLEDRRRALEGAQTVSELELSAGSVSAADDEALRMTDFAGASQSAQLRIAEEEGKQAVAASLIENDRDTRLMQAEIEANRKLGEIEFRYTDSIDKARDETERARLRSELEVEKAKAEAQREKALIEAEAAHDLSSLELRFQSRMADARQRANAANQSLSNESQAQRFKAALASAEAERRVQDDIKSSQNNLATLRSDLQQKAQPFIDEIAQLNDRIVVLKGQLDSIQLSYADKINAQTNAIAALAAKEQEFASVKDSLINEPALAVNTHAASSAELTSLEGELARARHELTASKSSRLASIDADLARKISLLSADLATSVSSVSQPAYASNSSSRALDEAAVRAELAVQKTQIANEARTQIAELAVKKEIAQAQVVSPVLTNRAVYAGEYGDKPRTFAARETSRSREAVAQASTFVEEAPKPNARSQATQPILVADTFEPKMPAAARNEVQDVVIARGVSAAGGVEPLVIAPSGTSYSVVYTYNEKGSADMFMNYLRAYGIEDFTYLYSEKLGQHVLVMGKYSSKQQAAGRVSHLNKTTSTSNAKIIETDF